MGKDHDLDLKTLLRLHNLLNASPANKHRQVLHTCAVPAWQGTQQNKIKEQPTQQQTQGVKLHGAALCYMFTMLFILTLFFNLVLKSTTGSYEVDRYFSPPIV